MLFSPQLKGKKTFVVRMVFVCVLEIFFGKVLSVCFFSLHTMASVHVVPNLFTESMVGILSLNVSACQPDTYLAFKSHNACATCEKLCIEAGIDGSATVSMLKLTVCTMPKDTNLPHTFFVFERARLSSAP